MPLTLRDAVASDAPVLHAAERAIVAAHEGLLVSHPDELSEAAHAERIASQAAGRAKVVVAVEEGAIVGHAGLAPMGLRRIAHVVRLDLCVHLGHWRRGHGRAMLSHLVEWARDHPDVHKIELLVRSTNAPAVALYERAGFRLEGRLVDRIRLADGTFVDDLSMAFFPKRTA